MPLQFHSSSFPQAPQRPWKSVLPSANSTFTSSEYRKSMDCVSSGWQAKVSRRRVPIKPWLTEGIITRLLGFYQDDRFPRASLYGRNRPSLQLRIRRAVLVETGKRLGCGISVDEILIIIKSTAAFPAQPLGNKGFSRSGLQLTRPGQVRIEGDDQFRHPVVELGYFGIPVNCRIAHIVSPLIKGQVSDQCCAGWFLNSEELALSLMIW